MKLSAYTLNFYRRLYHWVFPEIIHRSTEINEILQQLYPKVDWRKVRFCKGLPWFLSPRSASAIVMPGTWNISDINVYFIKYQPENPRGLSTIVHEGFHVLQYSDMGKGIGLMRRFLVHYLADYFELLFKNVRKKGWATANWLAYHEHPMEKPAYGQDFNFYGFCKRQSIQSMVNNIPKQLTYQHCGYTFRLTFFLLPAFLITLIFAIVKPFIELLFLLTAFPVWILGKTLQMIGL